MSPTKPLLLSAAFFLTACISLPEVDGPQDPPDDVPDSGIPPSLTVTLAAPSGMTYTNGTVSVQLQLQGDTPERVELLVDDQLLTTLQAPYTFTWDTSSVTEGLHRLSARARIADKTFSSETREVQVDRTPPQVVSRTPSPGAQDVWVRQPIQATFSEPLKPNTLTNSSVKLTVSGTEVATTPVLSADGKALTVTPSIRPTVPNILQLTLTNAITDLAGNAFLPASSEWVWSIPLSFPMASLSAVSGDTDAEEPSVQLDHQGRLFISWREPTGTSTQHGIYTYTWTGTNWQPVGGPILPANSTLPAGLPPTLLLDSTDKPFVVWTQPDGPSPAELHYHIHINRWNGTEWTEATTSPESSLSDPVEASSYAVQLDAADNPILVWSFRNSSTSQHSPTQVWRWMGNTWTGLGTSVSNNPPATNLYQPLRLLLDNEHRPIVASSEGDIFVSRWTGDSWTRIGNSLGAFPGDTPARPNDMLLDGSSNPVLAWGESSGTTQSVRISRWTGSVWEMLGSALDAVPGNTSPFNPRLQIDKTGNLITAWEEPSQENGSIQINFRHWTGAEWVPIGNPIIAGPGNTSNLNMSFKLDDSDNLYVTWLEKTGASAKSIQVHRYNY
jgi:hypothetical protein